MANKNLDEHCEVTNLNFDKDAPHIAICHKSQGFSANLKHDQLLFKSGETKLTQEIIKTLDKKVPEKVLTKMLKSNQRDILSDALRESLKESTGEQYVWVWIEDFSEDMVIFEWEGEGSYAVAYTIDDNEKVTFEGEVKEVKRRDMYVDTETGEELIKAVDWLKENPKAEEGKEETSEAEGEFEGDTPNVEEDEEIKVEKIELTPEQLQEEIQKALVKDRAEQEELRKAAELKASTEELVKGFSFVEEGDVEELVKSLIAEGGEVLVKALTAASEKVASLEVELEKATKEEEKEDEKEEAKGEEEIEKASETGEDRTRKLDEIVKAKLKARK